MDYRSSYRIRIRGYTLTPAISTSFHVQCSLRIFLSQPASFLILFFYGIWSKQNFEFPTQPEVFKLQKGTERRPRFRTLLCALIFLFMKIGANRNLRRP